MGKKWTYHEDVLCGSNKAKAGANLNDLGEKDIPQENPFEVRIELGKLLAPLFESTHSNKWLECYCGSTFLESVKLKRRH
jgi:hypothetical protein